MSMISNTLGRYFAGRFVMSALGVFASIFVLLVLVDYIEMVRRTSGLASASAITVAETSLFRVPQLLEKLMPFCVLIGAMTCYLALSRRLELVVARAAGVSAWQFISPALASALLLGILATTAYNPMSANLRELSKRMEAELFGSTPGGGLQDASGFWMNQTTTEGQTIINAARSEQQGVRLTGLTVFRFDSDFKFKERIEAKEATLEEGHWLFKSVRRYSLDAPPIDQATFTLATSLNPAQVRNSFSTPETVSFWQLPELHQVFGKLRICDSGISTAVSQACGTAISVDGDGDACGGRELRFFRFGGVQKMVLSGVGAGFLLYVLSKVTEDLSKAELMHPIAAAWLPVCVGGLTGFLACCSRRTGRVAPVAARQKSSSAVRRRRPARRHCLGLPANPDCYPFAAFWASCCWRRSISRRRRRLSHRVSHTIRRIAGQSRRHSRQRTDARPGHRGRLRLQQFARVGGRRRAVVLQRYLR